MKFVTDKEMLDTIREELYTCVVGDVMDTMGYTHQYLPPQLRPVTEGMCVAGRAKTVLEADCHGRRVYSEDRDHAFGIMFEALDSIKENEVYVCTGSSSNYACWGELMSTAAMHRGAVGAVVEGYSRDTNGIRSLNFPTFSKGFYGQDQGMRGRVIDYDCPIEFSNKVLVNPGDIVFGDIDGVVIIPKKIEAEVIEAALEKVHGENMVRKLIQDGMPARKVWDEYGIM
ncbi:RraA family protein [Pontiella sulfatireligans]|uniref:Putative 4-hydroxy-4-methyl-2-oxoglutarate aldolase n=1 Tax=Pontiella sulfatireligans TaxID=2750658 RepID=A0A6C2ULV1_9BACT|nr:RraA family protein [Pontiella sulfatireligans]VGO20407.1 4-hydroxy-4-methyl-2-oxoglutarate aldolase/4-carboxy-4-hydroxy-2-oxoadipate aldolase [Pontiella sulfatireligans]